MNNLKSLLMIAVLVLGGWSLRAQQQRLSPHETTGSVVDGDRVTVVYGRPYTKNPHGTDMRKIWGGLVPYGKVWRTGADEATLLVIQKPVIFGETTVPAGCYSLYTLPNEDGSAKLIINKAIGQWGTQYDEAQDLARVDLKKSPLDKAVDQFTITVEKGASGGGVLK